MKTTLRYAIYAALLVALILLVTSGANAQADHSEVQTGRTTSSPSNLQPASSGEVLQPATARLQ